MIATDYRSQNGVGRRPTTVITVVCLGPGDEPITDNRTVSFRGSLKSVEKWKTTGDNVVYKRVVNTSESSTPPNLINHLYLLYNASTPCSSDSFK
jgi:hypothetical protein